MFLRLFRPFFPLPPVPDALRAAPRVRAEPDYIIPSHRCTKCGAFWRLWRHSEVFGSKGDTWSVRSKDFCKDCDSGDMDVMVRPVTVSDLEEHFKESGWASL